MSHTVTLGASGEPRSAAALSPALLNRPEERRARIEVTAPTRRFLVTLGDRPFEVGVVGDEPDWLYPVLGDLKRFTEHELNWDSYGGLPLTFQAGYAGLDLLARILPSDAPAPAVVPTTDGGLQFEWHTPSGDLEIEVSGNGLMSADFEGVGGEAWQLDHSQIFDGRLQNAVSQV